MVSCELTTFVLLMPLLSFQSGCKHEDNSHNIVGGRVESRPYMGALINKTSSKSEEFEFFAGTVVIVSHNIAVTAAHTVKAIAKETYKKGRAFVRGNCDRLSDDSCVDHKVCSYSTHGDFNTGCTLDHNVAVIRVIQPFAWRKERVIPLPSWYTSYYPSTRVEVCGWGTALNDPDQSNKVMRCITSILASTDRCTELYRGVRQVKPEMICGIPEDHDDVCVYNSGGPMVFDGTLIGLHSWGRWCGNQKFPSVYTEVSYEKYWFQKHLEEGYGESCWNLTTYDDRSKYYLRRIVNRLSTCTVKLKPIKGVPAFDFTLICSASLWELAGLLS